MPTDDRLCYCVKCTCLEVEVCIDVGCSCCTYVSQKEETKHFEGTTP